MNTIEILTKTEEVTWPLANGETGRAMETRVIVTDELRRAAAERLPVALSEHAAAKAAENHAFALSNGEGSWRRNNGPELMISAETMYNRVRILRALIDGRNFDGWFGQFEARDVRYALGLDD